MPDAEIENLIMWNKPEYNLYLALIWPNGSALLLRSESCGWKPANIRVRSATGAACNFCSFEAGLCFSVATVCWLGSPPKSASITQRWFTPNKQGWFLAKSVGRPDRERSTRKMDMNTRNIAEVLSRLSWRFSSVAGKWAARNLLSL